MLGCQFRDVSSCEQARLALNQGIAESNVHLLKRQADETAKTLSEAVRNAQIEATAYQHKADSHTNLYVAMISGSICFVIGAMVVWSVMRNPVDTYARFAQALQYGDMATKYINKDCATRVSFVKYLHVDGSYDSKACNTFSLPSEEVK